MPTLLCSFRSALLLLLAVFVVSGLSAPSMLATPLQRGGAASAAGRPMPLDPLTTQERATAERLARGDSRVRDLLGDSGRLAFLEFVALKPDREDQQITQRHAELLFLRQDGTYGVRAVVRVSPDPAVVSVDKVAERDVPMTSADVDAARKLALASPDVKSFGESRLEKATVEGLRVVATDRDDPCFERRCVRLLFKIGNDYLSEPIVVVNLSTNAVSVQRRRQ